MIWLVVAPRSENAYVWIDFFSVVIVVQSVQIHHHEYIEYFMLVRAHGHFGRNNRWKMWKKEGIF